MSDNTNHYPDDDYTDPSALSQPVMRHIRHHQYDQLWQESGRPAGDRLIETEIKPRGE